MTTESRMREALEMALSQIEHIEQMFNAGTGSGETVKTMIREALSPPARRTSYEWVDDNGDRTRVRWSREQRRWVAEMIPPGCRDYHVYGGSAHYSLAAAIATLANLTPPEEEA